MKDTVANGRNTFWHHNRCEGCASTKDTSSGALIEQEPTTDQRLAAPTLLVIFQGNRPR
jgi:hypothetical protein